MWSCPKLVGPESNGLHWFANVCHDSHFAFEQCHSRNSPVAGIVPPEAHPYWWRWALVYTATPEDRGAAGKLPLEQEVYRVCFMCFINGQDLLAAVPTAFLQVGIPGILCILWILNLEISRSKLLFGGTWKCQNVSDRSHMWGILAKRGGGVQICRGGVSVVETF